jgi:AcrR family transcriptional regulator
VIKSSRVSLGQVGLTSRGTSRSVPGKSQESGAVVQDENCREILDAAAIAFMENGFAATSIDVVADILGASKGRVYYYFKSKADLFFEVHREAMRLNLETIRPIAIGPGSATDRLARMLQAQADLIMSHLPLQRVAIAGIELHLSGRTTPEQRETLRKLISMRDRFEKYFTEVLEEGIKNKEFRECDTRFVVKPLLGAINWMTFWYKPRTNESPATRKKIVREAVNLLMTGITRI